MKNIEIVRFKLDGEIENRLQALMNDEAKDFDLKTSFGPVTQDGNVYVFFVFEKVTT